MSGRVMIVDPVSTNRIVLKVKLLAARYEVVPCASFSEALDKLEAETPDIILVEASQLADDLSTFVATLRASRLGESLPVLGLGHFENSADRLNTLLSGIDDILAKPYSDSLLQARIRSLLRARGDGQEPDLPDETRRALGFAESAAIFEPSGSVVIISAGELVGRRLALSIDRLRTGHAAVVEPERALEMRGSAVPDLFVIDARESRTRQAQDKVFHLIADLRSRSDTRHAAQLVVLPQTADDMAAMSLDLGASETIPAEADADELSHRVRALLARKGKLDRLRNTLRTGLEAAMTDPLTGLHNRRFAMSYLTGLAQRSFEAGRSLAVMVLDIDHFKQVNDTYGHTVGDAVLVGVAELLRKNLRSVDLIARVGGEEFLVAMPEACADAARAAAERLRQRIGSTPFNHEGKEPVFITLSVGIAVAGPERPLNDLSAIESLLVQADGALYRSKTSGRNTVTLDQSAA